MDAILRCRMDDYSSWADQGRVHRARVRRPKILLARKRNKRGFGVKSSKNQSMADHNDTRKWMSVLALGFVLGACGVAISASPPRSPQDASAVTYRTNELGMDFVMVPPGE